MGVLSIHVWRHHAKGPVWILRRPVDGPLVRGPIFHGERCYKHHMPRWKISINGIVQGVGFRPTVYRYAVQNNLVGRCWNDGQGVFIEVQGALNSLHNFCTTLKNFPPPQAQIQSWQQEEITPQDHEACFQITINQAGKAKNTLIGPDLALCDACRQEIFDPQQRRYHYPFTNCTNCGPRFTIIYDRPYERSKTVMRTFKMCPHCQQEYDDPAGRRFHAEPNACPVCGPQLRWGEVKNGVIHWQDHLAPEAILNRLHEFLAQEKIGAVKGIGGFHLVGDATKGGPVRRLRKIKNRQRQALAVMLHPTLINDLPFAWGADRAIYEYYLRSPIAPIMLIPKPHSLVASSFFASLSSPSSSSSSSSSSASDFDLAWMNAVAPDTNYLGAILPYTPLHALMMEHFKALVMTSANLHEEPLAIHEAELAPCMAQLDFVLTHNRPILRACDDSIGQIIAGKISWLRWGRGLVPRPLIDLACDHLWEAGKISPGVALGALEKNNFALLPASSVGPQDLICSQHIGEIQDVRNQDFQKNQRDDFQRLWEVKPQWMAGDAHLAFAPRLAPAESTLPYYKILHHHAHAYAALAEHHFLNQEAWILTADGTGMGADQTVWGMEWWHYRGTQNSSVPTSLPLTRVATLHPLKLLGGERAIKEISRLALAMLLDLTQADGPMDKSEQERLSSLLSSYLGPYTLAQAKEIWASTWALQASSLGRLFDGMAALGLGVKKIEYSAQGAMLWQKAAEEFKAAQTAPWPYFDLAYPWPMAFQEIGPKAPGDAPTLIELDYRPMLKAMLAEQVRLLSIKDDATKAAPQGPGYLAYKFHQWLAEAILTLTNRLLPTAAPLLITGGCAQNKLLMEILSQKAISMGRPILFNTLLPPNDASIALGQAAAVACRISAERLRCD